MHENIEVGFQTFVSDGGEEFGAVRQVSPMGRPELIVYVENSGDFVVPLDAVEAVFGPDQYLNTLGFKSSIKDFEQIAFLFESGQQRP